MINKSVVNMLVSEASAPCSCVLTRMGTVVIHMLMAWRQYTISAVLLATCLSYTPAYAADGLSAKRNVALSGKLLISGSSTMAPMMAAVAKRFAAGNPGVQIEVRTSSTAQGIDDVINGTSNMGMVSRALTNRESGLYSFAIARDGVGLVVHQNNPIQSLTKQQVSDIYTGKINNWSKVGGNDAPIMPINAQEGFGTVELFTHFFGIRYADIKAKFVASDNQDRVKALIANPHGIAHMSLGTAQHHADTGVPLKLLPIDGVAATAKNIRSGNYPISRPLLLLTREVPTGLAKAFISFTLSSQITDLVLQHDYVPYLD